MTTFLFKEFLVFFKRFTPSGISIINRHLFILDGHESHVTFEVIIEQAQEFGFNMIILPLHTFHVLQPLDVACFKLFEIDFKKERNITKVRRNYKTLNR
jgi:hypothetical protein